MLFFYRASGTREGSLSAYSLRSLPKLASAEKLLSLLQPASVGRWEPRFSAREDP
jgi:hypothetical protein